MPSTYEDSFVNILFGENARYISKDELKNGNIIDITAAKILTERGIDVGIKEITTAEKHISKGFTDLPQEYFTEEDTYVRLSGGVCPECVTIMDGARKITEYVYGHMSRQTGDFEYENSDGMRFRVLSFDIKKAMGTKGWISSYARRRSILKSIKWLGKAVDISAVGNYPELYIITKQKGETLVAGTWNLFADKIENMRLNIDRDFTDVRFVNCKGHTEGNTIVLDSVLYPYEFAGFEIK